MAAFLQIDACPDCAANAAFEVMHKSMAETPAGNEAAIWAPHPNPYLTAHVEETSDALRAVLEVLLDTFARVLANEPLAAVAKAMPGQFTDEGALRQARASLEGRDPGTFSLADWELLVDLLIAEFLPPEAVQSQAERLVVRADLLGRIQAVVPPGRPLSVAALAHLHRLVPTSFAAVPPRLLNPVELATLDAAKSMAGLLITDLVDSARAQMKRAVVEHVQAHILGQREGTSGALRQRLFERFGDLNRDVRRIAITEIGNLANEGFIAACGSGARVKRVEAYWGACSFCASINDRVLTVVDPRAPNKDDDTQVWPGKSNVGRSASPRKKVGGQLVTRPAAERWTIPAGTVHPNCRGRWVRVTDKPPAVSQGFADWLDGLIRQAQGRAS